MSYMAGHSKEVTAPSGYRDRNSTADRALDVLQLFTDERNVWSGADISEQIGVARSTGYRYLQSLVSSGFIEEADGGFRLGPRILELARVARKGIGLSELALPVMRELAQELNESVLLTRRSRDAVVCLELVDSAHPIRLSYERGYVLPLNAGAAAEVLLAWTEREKVEEILSEAPLQRFTRRTLTDPKKLQARLNRINKQGYAVSRGELDENVLGVAAPIFGSDGRALAAVSIAALSSRVPDSELDRVIGAVQSAARRIAEGLAMLDQT
jgi:DNA-binding IclR family transcriptional regulator